MKLLRYLILIDRSGSSLMQTASRWQEAFPFQTTLAEHHCLILMNVESHALHLPAGKGVAIGTVFPRHGAAKRIDGDDRQWKEDLAVREPLTILRDRYWGGFIALLAQDDGLELIRDPGGAMPCYYMATSIGWAVASDAETLVSVGLLSPRIAWAEMPRYLTAKDLPCSRTGIEGLHELLAGTSIKLGAKPCAPTAFWSPWDYVVEPGSWDGTKMAECLRRTVEHCTAAWASTTDHILSTLSGGLDSSVVVASVARANADQQCITLVTQDRLGDEREYARAMAAHVGAGLHEPYFDLSDVDLSRSVSRHFPKAIGTIHETAYHAAVVRGANAIGADAVFTGNGGDSIFYNSASLRPLFDVLYGHGPGRQALRTFGDIREVTRTGWITALRETVKFVPVVRRPYAWPQDVSMLTADLALDIASRPPTHAWLDSQPRRCPGKVGHVAHLLKVQNHLEGYLRPFDLPMINPLMSQPVIELALSIPTWRMLEGGRDRAVVRKAYADALPSVIRDRRRKGSPSGFAMDVLTSKDDEVRQRLLDGALVNRRLVDPKLVEAAIPNGPITGRSYVRLLMLLDLEAWISHWQGLGG
jgi:asparagine synthase (glutamine-hydrolysing)